MARFQRIVVVVIPWTIVLAGAALVAALYCNRQEVIVRVGLTADRLVPQKPAKLHPDPMPTTPDHGSMWMRRKLEDDPDFLKHREERRRR